MDNTFLYAILFSLFYLIPCLLCAKFNLKKPIRARQILMPVIAVLYCLIAMIGMQSLSDALSTSIQGNETWFERLAHQDLSILSIHVIFILNAVLAFVFLALKLALLPILKRIFSSDSMLDETAGLVAYEQKYGILEESDETNEMDEADGASGKWWILKPDARQFKRLFLGFYITFFIVIAILYFVSYFHSEWTVFHVPFYPVFGILIFGEVFFALNGIEKIKEVEASTEPKRTLAPNFAALREELLRTFGEHILQDKIIEPGQIATIKDEDIADLISGEDSPETIVRAHFLALLHERHALNLNNIQSCLWLMKGKSVLFYQPFYRDLTDYLMLPIVKQFMRYQKCLVIVSRTSAAQDVCQWLQDALTDFSGTSSLWKAGILSTDTDDLDAGILRFSDIYNRDILHAHREFFQHVGFVLLIEPSHILTTGQMGLRLLLDQCGTRNAHMDAENAMVFCACDRNCDGLVDALSHTLKTNLTLVTATSQSSANRTYLYWDTDGEDAHHVLMPDVSHYLGIGTEINLLALKHDIRPACWISGEQFATVDMKWIDGQYYPQMCSVANIPTNQAIFNELFEVQPNLWNISIHEKACYTVEDEFKNLYEMTRLYSTRTTDEGCFNVLSEHYLLRDYMIEHIQTLATDPKAIPTIVPDFARTERNIVLKIIMKMRMESVREHEIEKELTLAGLLKPGESTPARLNTLFEKYCGVTTPSLKPEWKNERQKDAMTTVPVRYCTIAQDTDLDVYAQKLRPAYFIAEDEFGNKYFVGSILYGHVFQAYLPGQFISFEGKYYQVRTITPENGIVLRRAADHLARRTYYRQIQHIALKHWIPDDGLANHRTLTQWNHGSAQTLEITHGFADLTIHTHGYVESSRPCDLKHARFYQLNAIPDRQYTHKSVLKLTLPNSTPAIRYTLCLLLNEIFKTLYPKAYPYICATTPIQSDTLGFMQHAMPTFEDDTPSPQNLPHTPQTQDDSIPQSPLISDDTPFVYFIEDSDLDLGLLVSIDRNLQRLLELVAEVLAFHLEKISTPIPPEPLDEEDDTDALTTPDQMDTQNKPGWWTRLILAIKSLFQSQKHDDKNAPDNDAQDLQQKRELEKSARRDAQRLQRLRAIRYHSKAFLFYGDNDVPPVLAIQETLDFLAQFDFDKNPLQRVRKHRDDVT